MGRFGWGRAMAVLALAGALAGSAVLLPVSAHVTQDDPTHNWNQHYFDLAKQDFHTKQKANQRFLSECEPGSIAAGARIEVESLTSNFQNVNSLPGSSAFNCIGGGVQARRDGVGEYTLRLPVPAGVKMGNILVSSVVAADFNNDGRVDLVANGPTSVQDGTLIEHVTVYRLMDDGSGARMSKFDPPVLQCSLNFTK